MWASFLHPGKHRVPTEERCECPECLSPQTWYGFPLLYSSREASGAMAACRLCELHLWTILKQQTVDPTICGSFYGHTENNLYPWDQTALCPNPRMPIYQRQGRRNRPRITVHQVLWPHHPHTHKKWVDSSWGGKCYIFDWMYPSKYSRRVSI